VKIRWFAPLLLVLVGCSTGQGAGSVTSDKLYVENCWDGPFNLQPTFFASDPFQDTQEIRIQRGDRTVEESDGVILTVNDVSKIRSSELETEIPLGLPVGVRPPGFPIIVNPDPPQVNLSLYLNDTCHLQNGALYAVSGSIVFHSLFSGNKNENNADARLTNAEFTATVTDPRDATIGIGSAGSGDAGADGGADAGPVTSLPGQPTIVYNAAHESKVVGNFRFYFQRGIPAQPFP
jgi:hypothetical protein